MADAKPILVIGSLNMDLVARCERLPQSGQTVFGSDFFTAPGGKGANQAVAAARLGARVTMAGCVGNDRAAVQDISSPSAGDRLRPQCLRTRHWDCDSLALGRQQCGRDREFSLRSRTTGPASALQPSTTEKERKQQGRYRSFHVSSDVVNRSKQQRTWMEGTRG